jgi:hypothetical protein
MKNHRSEENKAHPSSKKPPCKPRQDKQMDPKPRSAKGCICYTCREKGHLGKDCPMVTLLNPTLSIMIFISLGMTGWTLVLWGWMVHLKLVQGPYGFQSTLWLIL